jgi:hypothetical protein
MQLQQRMKLLKKRHLFLLSLFSSFADVFLTSMHPALESNPVIRALAAYGGPMFIWLWLPVEAIAVFSCACIPYMWGTARIGRAESIIVALLPAAAVLHNLMVLAAAAS